MQHNLKIEIQVFDDHLCVVHTGTINDMDHALQCFETSLQQAQSTKKRGILADLTQIQYTPLSAIDRILFFQSATDIYQRTLNSGGSKIRLAILQLPEAESSYTPGIDAATDGGMECQLFYDRLAALSWLQETSA